MYDMNDELVNYIIGCLISADNNLTNQERESNIKLLQKIIENNIASDEQIHICERGIDLLKKEMKDDVNIQLRSNNMQYVELKISHRALHSIIHALGEKSKLSEYEENILKELSEADEFWSENPEQSHYSGTID